MQEVLSKETCEGVREAGEGRRMGRPRWIQKPGLCTIPWGAQEHELNHRCPAPWGAGLAGMQNPCHLLGNKSPETQWLKTTVIYLHSHVHSSIIHHRGKVEATQVSTDGRVDKQNIYPCSGICSALGSSSQHEFWRH